MTFANAKQIDRAFKAVGIVALALRHDRCWVIIERSQLVAIADDFDDICREAERMIEAQLMAN